MSRITFNEESYFATVDFDPLTNEETIKAVHRWYRDNEGVVRMERYDPAAKTWVPNKRLIAATGIGGDNDYMPISKVKADDFIEEVNNAEQD